MNRQIEWGLEYVNVVVGRERRRDAVFNAAFYTDRMESRSYRVYKEVALG